MANKKTKKDPPKVIKKVVKKVKKTISKVKKKIETKKANKAKKNEPKVPGTRMTQAEYDARNKKAVQGYNKKKN